jgi:hypothetical protein
MGIQEILQRKFFVSYISPKPFHCSCKKILPFLWSQPNACIVAEIRSAFSFLRVHSEFKYHSFISSYNGNETRFEDEIERQLKCKIRDMGLHSRVLQGVTYKGAIQLDEQVWVCVKPIHTSRG